MQSAVFQDIHGKLGGRKAAIEIHLYKKTALKALKDV